MLIKQSSPLEQYYLNMDDFKNLVAKQGKNLFPSGTSESNVTASYNQPWQWWWYQTLLAALALAAAASIGNGFGNIVPCIKNLKTIIVQWH